MAPPSCSFCPAAAAFCRARRAKWPSAEGGGSTPSGSQATPAGASFATDVAAAACAAAAASSDATRAATCRCGPAATGRQGVGTRGPPSKGQKAAVPPPPPPPRRVVLPPRGARALCSAGHLHSTATAKQRPLPGVSCTAQRRHLPDGRHGLQDAGLAPQRWLVRVFGANAAGAGRLAAQAAASETIATAP